MIIEVIMICVFSEVLRKCGVFEWIIPVGDKGVAGITKIGVVDYIEV